MCCLGELPTKELIDPSLLDANLHDSIFIPVSSDFQDVSLTCIQLHHRKVLSCFICMHYDEIFKKYRNEKCDKDLH